MTIQINPQASVPTTQRSFEATIGIDLSLLGASQRHARGLGLAVEHMSYPKLASAAAAAAEGGLDFLSLSTGFKARSDRTARTGALDAAKMAGRLAHSYGMGFSAAVPLESDIEGALELLRAPGEGWACVEFDITAESSLDQLAHAAAAFAGAGILTSVKMKADEAEYLDLAAIASSVDSVRLVTASPHEAREVRFALRSAALAQGKPLRVICELGIVISGSTRAATERAILVSMMSGHRIFADKAHVIGTVHDAADEAERWISAGAADGIVFLPASVPTDLASLIRGILPLLRGRGEVEAIYG